MWDQWTAADTAALTRGHAIATRVTIWRGDTPLGDLSYIDGTVTVDTRNRIRRRLTLTLDEALYPLDEFDALAPYGTRIAAWRGYRAGVAEPVLAPVFHGRIVTVEDDDEGDGAIALTAVDDAQQVISAGLLVPEVADPGSTVPAQMARIIQRRVPGAQVVDLTGSDVRVPAGLMWSTDAAQALDDLAKVIGAEWYADHTQPRRYIIRPVPTITDATPVLRLADGVDGTVIRAARAQSAEGVYNVVVATAERTDGQQPLRVERADENPNSPTYRFGPFGESVLHLRLDEAAALTDLQRAANTALSESLGLTRVREAQAVPNPALDGGDPVELTFRGSTDLHIAAAFDMPLTESQPMTVATRTNPREV